MTACPQAVLDELEDRGLSRRDLAGDHGKRLRLAIRVVREVNAVVAPDTDQTQGADTKAHSTSPVTGSGSNRSMSSSSACSHCRVCCWSARSDNRLSCRATSSALR